MTNNTTAFGDVICGNMTYDYDEYGIICINKTNSSDTENDDYFMLPWWQQTIFYLAFVAIFLIATGGNVIVIWIVLAHKRMRTVTNYFIVNLAFADFLISMLNLSFNIFFLLYQDWWFGKFFCKFSNFISPCTISVSVLTFMAIAIDRYTAILYPLRPRMPKRHVILAIIIIWIISIGLSTPSFIFASTYVYDDYLICNLLWSTDENLAYSYVLLILNYVFPLVTLTITYSRVGIELWGSHAIGEETSVQADSVRSKRKVVKMMILVVVIFALCWFPYHLYFLLSSYFNVVAEYEYTPQLYVTIYLVAMSNSMYNPIIYCWMNSRFREGFVHVFCWCPCRPCKKTRTRLRFRRTLFPTGANAMSEKYSERNGSMMHTMTEYVDPDAGGGRRLLNNHFTSTRTRKQDDFL